MKRSFTTYKLAPQQSDGYGPLVQPDFDALNIHTAWHPSEFSLIESVDLADASLSAEKPKDSQMMRQYLQDQLCRFPQGYDFLGGKSKVAKHSDSFIIAGGADAEPGCNFAKLAEDARELWEEMKPRDDDFNRQTGSCCTSMCSTLASAASTCASSTFSAAFAESSPAHFGATPSFGMDISTAPPISPALARRLSRSLSPIATLAVTSVPAHIASETAVATDAAVTAACRLLLQALDNRDAAAAAAAHSPSAAVRAAPRGELEQFSLGPGCPGA